MWQRSGWMPLMVLGTLTVALAAAGTAEAAVTTFPSAAPITLTDNASASPYPSAVTPAGLCGTVSAVRVTLTGLSHNASKDVDVMLISPANTKVMLVSDAGGATSNRTLIFDDAATEQVSQTSLTTGVWRPHNYADVAGTGDDFFAAPVPAGTVTDTLASFAGESPNGTWRLFARDDHAGTAGSIGGGWTLRLLTPNCPVFTPGPGDPFFDDGEGGLDPEEEGGANPTTGPGARLPSLTKLKLSSARFKASKTGGTKVSFTLSRAGSVKFTVERRAKGRRSGRRCVAPKRSNRAKKRCTRWLPVSGSIPVAGRTGSNSFTFRGKIGGKRLAAGGYRLNARAAATARREFTVVR